MALFRRKKTDSVLPEVDKYYEGERRDRAGLAWLLALISVVIVALIIIGVFLAGRWVYRQATKDNANDVAISDVDVPSFDGATDGQNGDDKNEEEKRAEEERKTEEARRAEEEAARGRVDAPVRTDTPSVPATGDNAPLPNTGPANLVGVFAGVTTLAGGIHYVVERRRSTR